MNQKIWFTPAGIEDLLPEQAKPLEAYRRQLLDGFHKAGYDLVLPPIAEYTDSLLTGTGSQLEMESCRFTDQETGKMMAVRADMTPQVARIVANRYQNTAGNIRLCYVGEVLRSKNNKAKGSRSPIQIGAELFGDSGYESDFEVIELMLQSITGLGLQKLNLSLGHVGVVNELFSLANLSDSQQKACVEILQRKALPEYAEFVANLSLKPALASAFEQLILLTGEVEDVVRQAKLQLAPLSEVLEGHVGRLAVIVEMLKINYPRLQIHLDLADLRGYSYHTGIIFSCYSIGKKLYPIARGGRYDGIAEIFGDDKPATGFSMDLRSVIDLLSADTETTLKQKIFVPVLADLELAESIRKLRLKGYRVIKRLPNTTIPEHSMFLIKEDSEWILVSS